MNRCLVSNLYSLCVLRNNTSLYSPWKSDAFSHPQHLSLQLQDAGLDSFVAADKTCKVSVEKVRGRERKEEGWALLCKSQHQDEVDSEIHTAWPMDNLCPLKKGTDKALAFSSALSACQHSSSSSWARTSARADSSVSLQSCAAMSWYWRWSGTRAQHRVRSSSLLVRVQIYISQRFLLRSEKRLLCCLSAQLLHSSWFTMRGFKLLHTLSQRKGFLN